MKREAQPALLVGSQQALDQYASSLKQEDLEAKSIRNYLSDLRQFIAWCECSGPDKQDERSFSPQRIAPPLLSGEDRLDIREEKGYGKLSA